MFKKFFIALILIVFTTTLIAQQKPYRDVPDPEKREIATINLTGAYSLGEPGSIGGGLDLSVNLPGDFLVGAILNGGMIFSDVEDDRYFSSREFEEDSSFYKSELNDGEFSFYLGFEFLKDEKIEPYVNIGIGFMFTQYEILTQEYQQIYDDVSGGTITREVDVVKSEASELITTVPVYAGVNFNIISWLQGSAYVKYIYYTDDLVLYASDQIVDRPEEVSDALVDVNEIRGNISAGLRLGIPITMKKF